MKNSCYNLKNLGSKMINSSLRINCSLRMKKIYALIVAASVVLPVMAQHKHLHIYRKDGHLTTSKIENVEKTEFKSTAWGDPSDVVVMTTKDGKTSTIATSIIDSIVVGHNVPVINITLTDYPYLKDLKKDGGFTKSTIYDATFSMDGNGYYEDIDPVKVEFRGRGNSTWWYPKTPYRFKFEKKRELCGMKKAKSFALIANYLDPTLMRNAIALKLAQMLGLPFTNHSVPVDVYLNGNYRGAYMLTEKIGIGGGSVDIDEEKGMLFEFDSYFDEDYKFMYEWTQASVNRKMTLPVMVKDPDLGELEEDLKDQGFSAAEHFNKWKADISVMLDAVNTRKTSESLKDVVDIDSFTDYLLVYLVTSNREICHPKSTYMYKEGLGSDYVYKFGPVWDFDWAYTFDGNEGATPYNKLLLTEDGDTNGATFFRNFLKNEEVKALFNQKWEKFYTELWPQLLEYMDEYAALIEPSAHTNGMIWPGEWWTESTLEFRKKYAVLKLWLQNRVAWANTHKNHGLY